MKTYTTTITLLFMLLFFSVSNAQTELISSNRDFYNGTLSPWSKSGHVFMAGSSYSKCNSCPGYTALGCNSSGTPVNHALGSLYRTVTIPNNVIQGSSAVLTVYTYISTDEVDNNTAYDVLDVWLTDQSANGYHGQFSNIHYSTDYVQYEFTFDDIDDYAGESMVLSFDVDGDGLKPTTFRIDDISLVVQTQNPCTYSLSSPSNNFPATGGSGSFTVTTQSNCTWNATTSEGWIFTTSSKTGTGQVTYSVQANSSSNSLTGYINVGGETFTVTQDGAPLLKADLTLSDVSASPNPVMQGHPTILTCKMKNVGLAGAQNVRVSYLLSNNCTTNTLNDYFLGSSSPGFDLSALTGEVTVQTAVHIPVDASWVGTKYIKCWIDFSDNVIETNNDNNIFCTQITINATMGQEFKLNETLLSDTSIISHLRWPFGRLSSWDSRNGFIGGSEFNGNPKGHGEKGHSLGEYYADDWTNQTAKSCFAPNENDSFYAPIEGKVIYINLWNICTNGCNPIPGDTCGNGFGNNIVIQSTVKPEFAFRVAHLKNINQTIINKYWSKQKVEIGEYLGCIGSTGNSDGPHAHCVLYQNIYSKDTIGGVPNIQAYGRLIAGLSAGINFNAPFYPNKFAANYKFDATWGGVTGSGGPTGFGASLEQQTFSVFPNPNKGSFTVHFETLDAEQMDFNIYNLIGEKLYSESFQSRIGSNERAYQLNNLPGGIYTVLLNFDNLSIRSKMIITN